MLVKSCLEWVTQYTSAGRRKSIFHAYLNKAMTYGAQPMVQCLSPLDTFAIK